MVTDSQTDFVYLSGLLPRNYPDFTKEFLDKLQANGIQYGFLDHTKDVWCVDYMPVQVAPGEFIQFRYEPDYLSQPKYAHLITDSSWVCKSLGISPGQSDLIIDGGNVVRSQNSVIATDKIFKENPGRASIELESELKRQLSAQRLIVVPQEPGDIIGHADGMVRFVDEKNVIVNQYPDTVNYKQFKQKFHDALGTVGFVVHEIPYSAWQNSKAMDASGCYINYLEVGQHLFVPVFGRTEDDKAVTILKEQFPGRNIVPVTSNDLAIDGGVLNCITWNIKK